MNAEPVGPRRSERARRRERGEPVMVPAAEFGSYYGRPIVKASPWEADIPAYLFLGGLAGGSSLLAAGADFTGRRHLRRVTRMSAGGAVGLSFAALVHDLGRPSRFHHMLRVAKITSPMSVGTWILTAYAPLAAVAALSEHPYWLLRPPRPGSLGALRLPAGRAAGWGAAALGPALASYTAVLLSATATPTWHDARRHLPFLFVGSAAAAAGGAALLGAPLPETGPARIMAIGGAALDLVATTTMEASIGVPAETLHQGLAGKYMNAAKALTATGMVVAAAGRRNRVTAAAAGIALLAGSVCTRFGVFHAEQQSARDPRYTVVPQRNRLDAGQPAQTEHPAP